MIKYKSLLTGNFTNVPVCVSEGKFLHDGNIVEAREAAEEDLLVVHSKRYLNRLKVASPSSCTQTCCLSLRQHTFPSSRTEGL